MGIGIKRSLSLLMVTLLVVALITPCSYSYADSKARTAIVTSFAGDVDIMKSGSEKLHEVKKDMKLKHGDRIITGKDSWVMLDLDGDKEVKIGDKTYISLEELTFEEGEDTSLKVFKGKVWVNIKKKLDKEDEFEVKTPNSVMGARGTKFLVSYDEIKSESGTTENTAKLTVIEGKVQAVSSAKVKVKDQNGNLVEKQLTIAVNVEEGEDVQLVLEKIQKELQSIADEVQALDETGQVNIADIQKVIESKISNEEMDAMNVKELKFDELDSFSIETIIQDIKNSGETDEKKDLLDNLNKVLDVVKKEEQVEQTKIETLINQITGSSNPVYTNSGSSGSSGSYVPPQPGTYSDIMLQSAKTIDFDKNGRVDKVELTFSKDIDLNSLNPVGIKFISDNSLSLGAITNVEIMAETENKLEISLLEPDENYNTGFTGKISIPSSAFKSGGLNFEGVKDFTVDDGAAPVITSWGMILNENTKKVNIVLSETINTYDNLTLSSISITDECAENLVPLQTYVSEYVPTEDGSFIMKLWNLNYTLVKDIMEYVPYNNGEYKLKIGNQSLMDAAGNYGVLASGENLLSCGYVTVDNEKPIITSVTKSEELLIFEFNEYVNFESYERIALGGLTISQGQIFGDKDLKLEISGLEVGCGVTLNGVKDLNGNVMESVSYYFDGSSWKEPFGYESAYTYGTNGTVEYLSINFNKNIDTQNFDSQAVIGGINLSNPNLGTISTATVSGSSLLIGLSATPGAFNSGETGTISVGAEILKGMDTLPNQGFEAPLIDKVEPGFIIDETTNGALVFRLIFSETMDEATVTDNNIDVYAYQGPDSGVYSITNSEFKVFDITLKEAAQVGDEISFNTNISDEYGNKFTSIKVIQFIDDLCWQIKN